MENPTKSSIQEKGLVESWHTIIEPAGRWMRYNQCREKQEERLCGMYGQKLMESFI